MRAVGTSQALDRAIGPPARLQEQMRALLLVLRIEAGMIRPPGPAGVGEDQDALGAFHEGGGIGLRGAGRARFELLPSPAHRDEALGAPRHLGDHLGAEPGDDGIEHGRDRRQRAKLLDQIVALGFGFGVGDRVAALVEQRSRAHLAGVIAEEGHLLDRECPRQIVDHGLARGEIDVEVGALVGRQFAQAAVEDRLGGADQLQHDRLIGRQMLFDRRDDGRELR